MEVSEYEKKWTKSETKEMIFYTNTLRIEGTFHKMPNIRVSDELNQPSTFISLTDVTIQPLNDGSAGFTMNFVALNKQAIVLAAEK